MAANLTSEEINKILCSALGIHGANTEEWLASLTTVGDALDACKVLGASAGHIWNNRLRETIGDDAFIATSFGGDDAPALRLGVTVVALFANDDPAGAMDHLRVAFAADEMIVWPTVLTMVGFTRHTFKAMTDIRVGESDG